MGNASVSAKFNNHARIRCMSLPVNMEQMISAGDTQRSAFLNTTSVLKPKLRIRWMDTFKVLSTDARDRPNC